MSDVEELQAYQKALMLLLKQVDLNSVDQEMIEAVERVYRLLGHFKPEQSTADSLESLRFLLGGK